MANNAVWSFLVVAVVVVALSQTATASDPDILSDFIVPANMSAGEIDGSFFTYTGIRGIFARTVEKFTVTKVSKAEMAALDGQSVSYAVLQYPAGGSVNPPHTHPRAAELLLVADGCLEVGLVDSTNKLYTQTLVIGDMFVFPKGLVHYQYNAYANQSATAISAFGSASAGTVSLPTTLFATGVDDEVLAKSFKTDVSTIHKIKAGFAH
ncbi:PREDICTED: germin-like protein 9-3 [Ipomoea nil]|uniref:germin-like protein 9-3 n=1 Tax=Ipomoea nil TaxID=35883 RepID=UPI000900E162|nr:PREDICTED: germin-like protein 9-3 [Ipomoea nil]